MTDATTPDATAPATQPPIGEPGGEPDDPTTTPRPVLATGQDDHLSRRFVLGSLIFAVVVSALLVLVLPAAASRVSELVTPSGAIVAGRASLLPQPGWELLAPADGEPDPQQPTLQKEGVVLGLFSVPADEGSDPQVYLDQLLNELGQPFVPDTDPVPFTSPTGDPGLAVSATGSGLSGMFAAVVSRDGSEVALVPAVGDPVALTALTREISDMITSVRFRRDS